MAEHALAAPRRRWARYVIPVVLCVLLGAAAGVALTVLTAKTYVASSTLFVTVPSRTAGELNDGNVFAEARVQSYADVATSPAILSEVIRSTGASISERALAAEVTATAPPNKVLLVLSVQDRSAQRALTLCRALDTQVVQTVRELEADGSTGSAIRLSVVRDAQLPTSPAAPRPVLYIGVATLLGLVVGLAVALTIGQLTRRRLVTVAPNTEAQA